MTDSLETAVLEELMLRQLRTNGVKINLNPEIDGRELLAAFIWSKRFEQLYYNAIAEFSETFSEERLRPIKEFFGALFHELAYMFMASSQPDSEVILTREDTLKFYMGLFPNAPLIRGKFGNDSLDGISVPDGIILKLNSGTAEITALCEYTKAEYPNTLIRKYNGMMKDLRRFGALREAHILFLAPKSVELPYQIELSPNVETREIPIDPSEFTKFFRYVTESHHISGHVGTLQNMINQARRRERKHANPGYSQQPLKTA